MKNKNIRLSQNFYLTMASVSIHQFCFMRDVTGVPPIDHLAVIIHIFNTYTALPTQ